MVLVLVLRVVMVVTLMVMMRVTRVMSFLDVAAPLLLSTRGATDGGLLGAAYVR